MKKRWGDKEKEREERKTQFNVHSITLIITG